MAIMAFAPVCCDSKTALKQMVSARNVGESETEKYGLLNIFPCVSV